MRKRIFLLVCVMLCIQAVVTAQTVHFVTMFDTNDDKIGTGMKAERQLIQNEMQTIAGYLEEYGYDSELSDYYGSSCGRASLMKAISGLQVGGDDVVVFYYGGHGARAYNNESDRFPQMCLGEDYKSNWVPSTLIKNMIKKKNPRLTVVLTGCCNKEDNGVTIKSVVAQSQGYTSEANVNKEAYKRLFLETTGVVQMTSSVAGELSYCVDDGSFFCLALLDVLDAVGQGQCTADWNSLCQNVRSLVSSLNIPTREGVAKQHPYFEVSVNGGSSGSRKKDDPSISRKVNDTDYDLTQDLERLLDKSVSRSARLQMVSQILSKHFTSDAKVLTLGRDMKTVVDYEEAETFLRRIAMSPYISQINVVEQSGGKNSLVRVHEVRTR